MTARGDRKIKTFFSTFAVSPEIWKTTEELQTCSPIKSISFAKTHKTGSSTVQNIFLRYGWENNLTFVLPEKRTWMFGFKTQFRSGSSGYISPLVAWSLDIYWSNQLEVWFYVNGLSKCPA